ncbi:hypothetical protein JX266_013767 [Neoarthrinium moseri]|nr:hypothetical protein JX266_013767 [Neoarthrinium moseri]
MSSLNWQRLWNALYDYWEQRSGLADEIKHSLKKPEQAPLDSRKPNWLLYYGATFNPPHNIHMRVIQIVHGFCVQYSKDRGDFAVAGSMIGCSSDTDVKKKTCEQNKHFGVENIIPLSSLVRLQLWVQGFIEMGVTNASVSGFSDWEQVWALRDFLQSWWNWMFTFHFVRVMKLDDTKGNQNSVFEDSEGDDVFEPLYSGTKPGSGEVPRGQGRPVGMQTTIVTDIGGQGSWMSENTRRPRKLRQYEPWIQIEGRFDSSIQSVWRCSRKEETHEVIFICADAGPKGKRAVQSVDCWRIISNPEYDDDEKVTQLRAAGFLAPSTLLQKVKEMMNHRGGSPARYENLRS